MAHIRTHTDGRTNKYEVVWSIHKGKNSDGSPRRKFHSQSFRTKEQAEAFERQKEDEAAIHSPLLNPKGGRQTVGHWAEAWFKDYTGTVKPSTATKCRGLLDASVLPEFESREIRKVSTSEIQGWLRSIESTRTGRGGKPISPPTIKHHYLVLRSVLNYAAANGAIAANPAAAVRLPTYRSRNAAPPRHNYLDIREVQKLAAEFPDPYNLLVEFLAFTGLRVAEAAGLNIEDLDFSRDDPVHVHRTRTKVKVQKNDESAKREAQWVEGTTKNGESRWAPLPGPLAVRIQAYLADRPNSEPDAPLWPGRRISGKTRYGYNKSEIDWTQPWNPGLFYRRQFKPTVRATDGIPDALRLHDLRHSFASICASNQVPAAQIAEWLGHRSEIVTRTIYTHLFKDDTKKYGARLSAAYLSNSTEVISLHQIN